MHLKLNKDASERTANLQKRQLCEQIRTISDQCTAEKDAREKWIERYESEYKSHFETSSELLRIRTDYRTLEHKANDFEVELNNLKRLYGVTENSYETTKEDYTTNLTKLEHVTRELESTKGMLSMVEYQHNDYVTRLRSENKKLVAQHLIQIRNLEMNIEDICSLLAGKNSSFKEMTYQSERDRVERRIVEKKLTEMTKEKDKYRDSFMTTYQQLSESDSKMTNFRYEYDELMAKYKSLILKNNQTHMQQEDYRSRLMNNVEKFKEMSKKNKELKEWEKDLRKIKKRDNPYEYVDFNDVSTQTQNPVKERGCNTDEVMIEYLNKPIRNVKLNTGSSFADTVTSVLGGIPAITETITEFDLISPSEYINSKKKAFPVHLKTRPQSSQLIGNTYSYNIKNGIIEEENDPLALNPFSTRSKDQFRTASSIAFNNFNSPSVSRPTALQRHQKAFKSHYENNIKEDTGYSNVFQQRAKTALSTTKERGHKHVHKTEMKSVYVHSTSDPKIRPMSGHPIVKQSKHIILNKVGDSDSKYGQSRPISQDNTMSKTQIQVCSKASGGRSKTSLRNLIKVASTRNES